MEIWPFFNNTYFFHNICLPQKDLILSVALHERRMTTSVLKKTKKEPYHYTAKKTQKVSNGTNNEWNENYYTKNIDEKTATFIDMYKTILL